MTITRIKTLILVLSFAYAVLRYHIFGDVAWAHLPLFVTNKALSFAGLLLLGCSLIQSDKSARKHLGQLSAVIIAIHILISFIILNKHYFAKFFLPDDTFTLQAELSMLAGILAAILLSGLLLTPSVTPQSTATSHRPGWGRAIILLTAVHVAFMGYTTWLKPSEWQGYLPPITLLSFLASIGFVLWKSGRRSNLKP